MQTVVAILPDVSDYVFVPRAPGPPARMTPPQIGVAEGPRHIGTIMAEVLARHGLAAPTSARGARAS